MNIYCCPPGIVEQPDPNAGWKYFNGVSNLPFIMERETYVLVGRIGEDGNYGGPVGTWGYGNYIFRSGEWGASRGIAYDWHTLPAPNWEEAGAFHLWSEDTYPKLVYFTLDLHTKGWATLAGLVNDLWIFGGGIQPVQPFIPPRCIAQIKIGENPQ